MVDQGRMDGGDQWQILQEDFVHLDTSGSQNEGTAPCTKKQDGAWQNRMMQKGINRGIMRIFFKRTRRKEIYKNALKSRQRKEQGELGGEVRNISLPI
jgi:hypothetical protein